MQKKGKEHNYSLHKLGKNTYPESVSVGECIKYCKLAGEMLANYPTECFVIESYAQTNTLLEIRSYNQSDVTCVSPRIFNYKLKKISKLPEYNVKTFAITLWNALKIKLNHAPHEFIHT